MRSLKYIGERAQVFRRIGAVSPGQVVDAEGLPPGFINSLLASGEWAEADRGGGKKAHEAKEEKEG